MHVTPNCCQCLTKQYDELHPPSAQYYILGENAGQVFIHTTIHIVHLIVLVILSLEQPLKHNSKPNTETLVPLFWKLLISNCSVYSICNTVLVGHNT